MPWIKVIPEREADGELKEVYAKIRARRRDEMINRDRDPGSAVPPNDKPDCY